MYIEKKDEDRASLTSNGKTMISQATEALVSRSCGLESQIQSSAFSTAHLFWENGIDIS